MRMYSKIVLIGVTAALLLSGCRSAQIEQQEEHEAQIAHVLADFAVLETRERTEWALPKYDILRKHLVQGTGDITPEIAASDTKPSHEEKDAIYEWANFGLGINKERMQIAKEYLTEDYEKRFDEILFNIIGKRLELYEGKLTYAAYLAEVKDLDDQFKSVLSELDSYHSQLVTAARERRAEQKARQIRLQQRILERRREAGIQHGPLRCQDVGDSTLCNY